MEKKKLLVVGFIFTPDFTQVLLIHKNRPEWQKGKMNGIGGKAEEGENAVEALIREVREETSLAIRPASWTPFVSIETDLIMVNFFATTVPAASGISSPTDELVEWVESKNLPENVISNLNWLVPMAIDKLTNNFFNPPTIFFNRES